MSRTISRSTSLVGVLGVPVVAISLLPTFAAIVGVAAAIAAIVWPILLLVEKLLPAPKRAPIVHPRDTEAGRAHAARMADLLNR